MNLSTDACQLARKRSTSLQARAALAGITLRELEGDFGHTIYIATRWALTKQFENLDEVEHWLDMVTGKKS